MVLGTFRATVFRNLAKLMLVFKGRINIAYDEKLEAHISALNLASRILFTKDPEDLLSPTLIKSQYDSLRSLLTKIHDMSLPSFLSLAVSEKHSESEIVEILVSCLLNILISDKDIAVSIKILTEIDPKNYLNVDKLTQEEHTMLTLCHKGLKELFSDDS